MQDIQLIFQVGFVRHMHRLTYVCLEVLHAFVGSALRFDQGWPVTLEFLYLAVDKLWSEPLARSTAFYSGTF